MLLIDVMMPASPGPEVAAEAVRLRPNLPVLYMTGDRTSALATLAYAIRGQSDESIPGFAGEPTRGRAS